MSTQASVLIDSAATIAALADANVIPVLVGPVTGTGQAVAAQIPLSQLATFFESTDAPVHIVSANANAFSVGLTGATNPAFNVDSSTASQVAGLNVVGAATGGTVAVVVSDSGSNANLTLNAKGSGTIGIGSVSTGTVTITPLLALAAGQTFVTSVKSTTALATPSSLAATQWTAFASTVSGAAIMGFGTTNDVSLMNRAGTVCLGVGPNTTAINIPGTLLVSSTSVFTGAVTFSSSALSTSPTGGIGYAVGAGGAQTQGTDKATTVASNTVTTAITMNAAALNAGIIVSFTFTNTSIAATDDVLVKHVSAGTMGCYMAWCTPGAGTSTIYVKNISAGNLSEAIVLRVTVVKAVSS